MKTEKQKLKKLKKQKKEEIKKVKLLNKPHINEKKFFHYNVNLPIINFENVHKIFTNGFFINHALKNINLKIYKKDFVVILGKSGSGKTTLMNIMSGLNRASSGSSVVLGNNLISFKDNELRKFRKENTSFVFQQYGLVQTLNVYENVKSGAYLRKDKVSKDEIMNTLQMFDINHKFKAFPRQLSGGQQQRTSIARALIKRPQILFCDEPTGSLDSVSSYNVLNLFKQANEKYNTTIIIITHDSRIGKLANHLIEIENGEITKDSIQEPMKDFKNLFV